MWDVVDAHSLDALPLLSLQGGLCPDLPIFRGYHFAILTGYPGAIFAIDIRPLSFL